MLFNFNVEEDGQIMRIAVILQIVFLEPSWIFPFLLEAFTSVAETYSGYCSLAGLGQQSVEVGEFGHRSGLTVLDGVLMQAWLWSVDVFGRMR